MKNLKKEQGLIKEIIVVVIVIFILAYYNLDPKTIWNEIVSFYNSIISAIPKN